MNGTLIGLGIPAVVCLVAMLKMHRLHKRVPTDRGLIALHYALAKTWVPNIVMDAVLVLTIFVVWLYSPHDPFSTAITFATMVVIGLTGYWCVRRRTQHLHAARSYEDAEVKQVTIPEAPADWL